MPDLASKKIVCLLLYKLSYATIGINLHPDIWVCYIVRRAVKRKVMHSRKSYRPQIMKDQPFPSILILIYITIIVIDVIVYEKLASICYYLQFRHCPTLHQVDKGLLNILSCNRNRCRT